MKTILILLALLAIAVVGWAEDDFCQTYDPKTRTTVNTCFGDPDAYDRLMTERATPLPNHSERQQVTITTKPDHCLGMMQMAMFEMEKLLQLFRTSVSLPEFQKQSDVTYSIWNAAKKECWRQP